MSASPEPHADSPGLETDNVTANENASPVDGNVNEDALPDNLSAGDMSDDESVLSDVDEAQFEGFDPANVAIDDRPALAIDEENLKLVGRHKRRRAEGDDDGQRKKKKEGRREKKSHRKKQDSDDMFSGGEELDGKRSRKRRDGADRSGKSRSRKEEEELNEEQLDPATRESRRIINIYLTYK